MSRRARTGRTEPGSARRARGAGDAVLARLGKPQRRPEDREKGADAVGLPPPRQRDGTPRLGERRAPGPLPRWLVPPPIARLALCTAGAAVAMWMALALVAGACAAPGVGGAAGEPSAHSGATTGASNAATAAAADQPSQRRARHAADRPAGPLPVVPREARRRGVSWVAGGPIGLEDLRPLPALGVDTIAQTPFGWQPQPDEPDLALVTGGRIYWGETDEGLRITARLARQQGIATLLKPHVWVRGGDDQQRWPGAIAMRDEVAWRQWFTHYRELIVHYARLAEAEGMPALCVGTELDATAAREAEWRQIIAAVRAVYRGQLTYAANWSHVEAIPFWDALDLIGVQGYFPLATREAPPLAAVLAAWDGPHRQLQRLAARWGKPVLVTELGYRSSPDALVEPWRWPARWQVGFEPSPQGLATQALAYEAFFRTFWEEPWLAGVLVWKWYPGGRERAWADDFTPQGKPAEQVLRRWFARSPTPAPAAAPAPGGR